MTHEQALTEAVEAFRNELWKLGFPDVHRKVITAFKEAVERMMGKKAPDWIYDPDDWEVTHEWGDRDLLVDDMVGEIWEPKEFGTLIKGPSMWAKEVVLTRDENDAPDETEVRWFKTLEEAERA